jgi:hypothetical protein
VPDLPPDVQAAMREWQAVTDDLVAIARAFDPARLDAGSACGGWTNRELLVHLATGYGVRIAALQAALDGAQALPMNADDANASNVSRLRGAPVGDIVAEMIQARGRVLVLLARLRAEHMDTITVLADGRPLAEALTSLNAHDLVHAAELRG